MIPIRYSYRSILARKGTSLVSAAGIALVVFVLASSLMLSVGIEKTLGGAGKPDNAIVLAMGSDSEPASYLDTTSVPLVLAAPGIKRSPEGAPTGIAEVVVIAALERADGTGATNVAIRGVPEDAMRFRPEIHIVAGRPARAGSNEAIVGASIRGRLKGLDLGETFALKKNVPVTVVGVFDAQSSSYESEIWADRELTRQAYQRQSMFSSVRVQLESAATFDAFRAAIENDPRLGLQALRESAFYEKQSEGTATFIRILGSVIAVFFAAGAMIGATITMYSAVANRQREIGTLRALGFSRTSVLAAFLLEAVILAGMGGALGAAASLAMRFVRFSMINYSSWSEIVFSFDPTPGVLAIALTAACGMGLLGGLSPAIRAASTSPLKAIRGA